MKELKVKQRSNQICYGDAFHIAHGAYLMAMPNKVNNKGDVSNVINEKKYTMYFITFLI